MNHPKGDESTSLDERYSLTYHLSSTLCSAAEQAPTNAALRLLRPGRTFRSEAYAAGLAPFLWRNLRFHHWVRRQGRAEPGPAATRVGRRLVPSVRRARASRSPPALVH